MPTPSESALINDQNKALAYINTQIYALEASLLEWKELKSAIERSRDSLKRD